MANRLVDRRAAFTLIEVLVVVAIIALLVSILLPSLAKARDRAKEVVCMAHMTGLQRAEAAYETNSRGFIVGSPLTTGYFVAKTGGWDPSQPGFVRTAIDLFDFSTPLRAQMFGVSSIPGPKTASANDVAAARAQLYLKLTGDPFSCPKNALIIPPWPANTGYPSIKAPSFLSMWSMMRGGPGVFKNPPPLATSVAPDKVAQASNWEMIVPDNYVPHVDRVGRASMKVFLADGMRFYNSPTEMDYSTQPNGSKGIMSGAPPSVRAPSGNPEYAREYGMGRKFSYRHGNNDRINAVFFDGHVEGLTYVYKGEDKPWGGSAVHPKYYYPTNTVVNDPTQLHVSLEKGTVLP